jgi:hypothetical protein
VKILGRIYRGGCLQLPVPLGLDREVLGRLRTTGQRVSALYWLEFWREALDRAIVINTNNRRSVRDLKKVEEEYAWMIGSLKKVLKRSSLKRSSFKQS